MGNINFDFIVLGIATANIMDLTKDPKTAAMTRDLLMVFINHGVELPIAIDIMKDVTDILVKS